MKIDRLISIIMFLNNRNRVTAKELAERYEVSIKTIQRDIESIDMAGVPIVSYKGQDGGYEILDNYKINSSAMNKEDVYLITKLLEGLGSTYSSQDISSLKEKFIAIGDNENSSNKFIMDFSPWGNENKTKEKLTLLDRCFIEKREVKFEYCNLNGEHSKRRVEPLKLIFKSFSWYLYAFCLEKEDTRIFKVKRMRNIQIGDEFYNEREIDTSKLFNDRENNIVNVKLKVSNNFLKKADDYFDEYELDKGNIIKFSFPLDEWIYSMILGFGSEVEVLEPLTLRESIKNKIKDMNNIYK